MSDLTTKAAEIRAGLVADWRKAMEGVTPGPWHVDDNHDGEVIGRPGWPCRRSGADGEWRVAIADEMDGNKVEEEANAAWIARCSPAGIAPLLALIEQQAAADGLTIERLSAELRKWDGDMRPHPVSILLDRAAGALEARAAELAEARAEVERLKRGLAETEDALTEARHEPWPDWCTAVLAVIRKHSGYDGQDDHDFRVDLPQELDETLEAIEGEADRWRDRAATAESERDELLREKERLGAGWRPIETAPKDGTKVRLAWSPDDWATAEGLYREGEWFAAPLFYRDGKSKPGMMYLEFREYRVTPNYWMPLSPPPEGSGQNLADANSKSPAPSSQSERIAVLEAALATISYHYDNQDLSHLDFRVKAAECARAALAPLGEE